MMKMPSNILLATALAASMSCRSASVDEISSAMSLLRHGNRTVTAESVAAAFHVSPDCSKSSFENIIKHTDKDGCLVCVSFDVRPLPDCRYEVQRAYITVTARTRDAAIDAIQRYIDDSVPPSSVKSAEEMPLPTSARGPKRRLTYQLGGHIYEAHLQASVSGASWVATVILFQYDSGGAPVE
jgi:hypothetical protein